MAHDAFISHSHEDKPVADAVTAALEAAGVRCWIAPRDIIPGSEWGEAIITAIGKSRLMVVVFSAHANSSKQVLREVERCVSRGIILVPFRVEDISPTGSMEYFLGTPHWLDALSPPMEQHIARLVATVQRILDVNASVPPTMRMPALEPQPKSRPQPRIEVPKDDRPPEKQPPLAGAAAPIVPPLGPHPATWFEGWRIGVGAVAFVLGLVMINERNGDGGSFWTIFGLVLIAWRVLQPDPSGSPLSWPRRLVLPIGVTFTVSGVISGVVYGMENWQYTAVLGLGLSVWGLVMQGRVGK